MNDGVSKVIIELDHSYQTIHQLRSMGQRLSRMIYQPFTIWFKSRDIKKDLPLIKSFILPLMSSNPFLMWKVILEIDSIYSLKIIERVKKSIHSKEIMLTDGTHASAAVVIYAIFAWGNYNREINRLSSIRDVIPFIWSLNISCGYDWRGEINNIFREKYGLGILIDFEPKPSNDFIIEVLEFLCKNPQSKRLFFRNFAINYLMRFMLQKTRYKAASFIKPVRKDIESILSIDKNMNLSSVLTPSNATVMDIIEYQIGFQKILNTREVRM